MCWVLPAPAGVQVNVSADDLDGGGFAEEGLPSFFRENTPTASPPVVAAQMQAAAASTASASPVVTAPPLPVVERAASAAAASRNQAFQAQNYESFEMPNFFRDRGQTAQKAQAAERARATAAANREQVRNTQFYDDFEQPNFFRDRGVYQPTYAPGSGRGTPTATPPVSDRRTNRNLRGRFGGQL